MEATKTQRDVGQSWPARTHGAQYACLRSEGGAVSKTDTGPVLGRSPIAERQTVNKQN